MSAEEDWNGKRSNHQKEGGLIRRGRRGHSLVVKKDRVGKYRRVGGKYIETTNEEGKHSKRSMS